MVEKIVPQSPEATRNSVMEATMQTEDSLRTEPKAASNEARTEQSMTWEFFMDSREAMLSPVIFRRTLASPMMETILDILMKLSHV